MKCIYMHNEMELTKRRLAEKITVSLQRDVGSFARNLPHVGTPDSTSVTQCHILLNCELPPSSCDTGDKLLRELVHPQTADITVKVAGEKFLCHKEVLVSRCEYFKAMLQNKWNEAGSTKITLNDLKPEAMAALLCFLYGAFVEIPKFCPLRNVLQISDMFGVTDLTDVVKHHIKVEMCHSFHKPCKVCIANAPEVIQLASIFSLDDLTDAFWKWNMKYFFKLWPTKGFASLQADLRQKCAKAVVESLMLENAVHCLIESDKLLSSLTRVQWTKPVVDMGTELMESCCDYISSNILNLTTNKTIIVLFQGMGWKTNIVERILLQIGDDLTVENVCNAHLAINRLVYMSEKEKWIEEFSKILLDLKKKIHIFLISNYYAVIHTEPWQRASSGDKMLIKSEALCHGDSSRKLSKKPVLSSSLHMKPPMPSVLKRQPMKIKPRKNESAKTQNGKVVHSGNRQVITEDPPQRQPVLSTQEMLVGGILSDFAVKSILHY